MSTRHTSTRGRNTKPRNGSRPTGTTKGGRKSTSVNVTGLRLGSLITFNIGGGRGGRRRGGGLFARLKRFTVTGLAALKGANYDRAGGLGPAAGGAGQGRGGGGGSFADFRASRPDLFGHSPDPDSADLDDPDALDGEPETGPDAGPDSDGDQDDPRRRFGGAR